MPLNYLHLKNQITDMGSNASARNAEMRSALELLTAKLNEQANEISALQQLVEEEAARNKGLRCAAPVSEALNTRVPVHLPAPACTILSADGSQVTPDPHDTVLYGLVNIGVFRIQPGSGLVPSQITSSTLIYGDELYASGGTASEDLVNLLRDVQEREMLAKLAAVEAKPVVTLTDGPLELYHEPRQEQSFKQHFDRYLHALDDLAVNSVITAGYVSRPRADLVVKLLSLLGDSSPDAPGKPSYTGLTDIALFAGLLAPGERSAIFRVQSRSASEYEGRKALHFFYLNVSSGGDPAFARVEIPLWVAGNPAHVQLLHSVLVEQSRLSGSVPYPYPLLRAHEIAVVRLDDRQQLNTLIENEMVRRGFPPSRKSEKQVHKDHTGRKRK